MRTTIQRLREKVAARRRDESGLTDIAVFLLTLPVIVGVFLIMLNVFVTLTTAFQIPNITRTGATVTAAAGSGTTIVPYVPSGGQPQSAEDYVRAQTESALFVSNVDSVTCGIPIGSGEALSVARCAVTYEPIVIGAKIFNNDIYQLFGKPMTVAGEDIVQTGINVNVQ